MNVSKKKKSNTPPTSPNSMRRPSLDFKFGEGKICFATEIESDPTSAEDWSLQILVIPDLSEPDHEHYFFNYSEIIKIRNYLDEVAKTIESLK